MIEFKNVSASYDGELAVLRDVSFTVNDGDFVAFVGTNGAGKSTTMRLANGLLKPTSGEVLVDGVPTTALKTSELARKIGFLFQNPDRQICCNTVREELLFGFKALGEEGPEAEARVDAMIERFGFDGDAEPYLLNRGTRQLLALASIIVLAPPTIILDEPTTGLDFRECVKVMDIVRELNESGTTVIMVCHDMEVVGDFAHRVIAMTAGQVVADGATFDVLRDGEVLKAAHILPPQVSEVSMILGRQPGCAPAVAAANTVPQMVEAVAQAKQAELQDMAEAAALANDVLAVLAAEQGAAAAGIVEAPADYEAPTAATVASEEEGC
ncbi:energy-coupling factor ABC transporter ATP-binding protein [uncultured Adlercreutzia sp.]|uniref:energy-coupling factor ABC transporter ATP-binding protein n=1 Tax=uncultured Adlercreutzia sp. TaxID=875803 RepID=UPI0025F21BA8|nr:ABC transporter ATP-binding protein [uncultured Adlercreutzia sp.]MCI9261857.1 ABC transporter ATP-binding protein [Eggerthellaceae bacterium]